MKCNSCGLEYFGTRILVDYREHDPDAGTEVVNVSDGHNYGYLPSYGECFVCFCLELFEDNPDALGPVGGPGGPYEGVYEIKPFARPIPGVTP